ncbi:MAG: hypothetical protein GY937_15250 [bacterium]|nr:hypothetical protein [bacterium]
MKRLAWWAGLVFAAGCMGLVMPSPVPASPLEDALPSVEDPLLQVSGREVIERAFENLYGVDLAQQIEIVTRKRGRVSRRHAVTVLRKKIRGRSHTLLDYRLGNELYGLRTLRIEHARGSYDRFIFAPELQRVRRFTSA